ncbi:MAG: phage head morphogenesis protein [Bacteroidales bacterium]|jgi:SPP1 gp7 family putative phage head morphogenesis protein|nr:phage head morphogenesis protein [Bacteroidales bacterium]
MDGAVSATQWFRFQTFTSAVIEDSKLRLRIKAALKGSLKRGEGYLSFRKIVDSEFEKAGLSPLANHRVSVIYRTNTANAFAAGQMVRLAEVAEDFPFWQYVAIKDTRTREDHAKMHGKIFRVGDYEYYPPIGFGCRCTAVALTAEMAGKDWKKHTLSKSHRKVMNSRLQNAEFIGNKFENYIKWVAKEYDNIDTGAQQLVTKQLKQLERLLQRKKPQ